MNKVIKYQTVTDRLANHLDRKVASLLKEGWELHGDQNIVTRGSHHEHVEYSQVMIKWERTTMPYYVKGEQE